MRSRTLSAIVAAKKARGRRAITFTAAATVTNGLLADGWRLHAPIVPTVSQHDGRPEPWEGLMPQRQPVLPDRNSISPDDPLRLAVAAALAYPDGSMTASGLRKEAA